MQEYLAWAQPIVTVVSLTFGGGILYGDVQDVKQKVESVDPLVKQVSVVEAKLTMAEESQRRTVATLDKVADAVNKLNITVSRLETKLEK